MSTVNNLSRKKKRFLNKIKIINSYFAKKQYFTYIYNSIFLISTGTQGKMRRNLENTHGFAQATHTEVLQLKATITRIESQIEGLSAQVHKATFKTVLSDCDLSEFFPVETQEQLHQFMDRDHKDWECRKMEFYHFLYTTATSIKSGFGRGLIKAIFSREYIMKFKWPSSG